MAKTFVFDRFDVCSDETFENIVHVPNSEGDWVKSQEAIDRDESLKAQIRVLEVQLKESKQAANSFREAGVWEPDGKKFMTYRNENLDGRAMYVKE